MVNQRSGVRMRTIGLEEHFVTEELAGYGAGTATIAEPHVWAEMSRRLLDLTGARLERMDAAGLDVQVLSLNSPGLQAEPDAATAVSRATAVNDLLAATIEAHPTRFAGFAALPLQDPQAAAKELERSVTQLGLRWARDPQLYYEDGFQEYADRGGRVGTAPIGTVEWVEVDDHADLAKAREVACRC